MKRRTWLVLALLLTSASVPLLAADADLLALLGHEIIGPRQAMIEVQDYCEARVPKLPQVESAAEWDRLATQLRTDVLAKVVFRGEAAAWRDAETKVERQETIPGGPGYRIKPLRYEAVPGLWIPALLYEPENLKDKVPVILNVNGHDANGKAADYKQARCVNLAKRGMLALNVEWLGMGQLRGPGFAHYALNQLDLCGTSGVSPFYLSMKRGIDVLLSHANADPQRVAVTGLSGGGWQTIFISGLDTRVTLSNPVAGYSSFRTRVRHLKDLGDSEQTPCDLATVADYIHLTAMRAPRPTLLTFNGKDNCCFEAGYALPPLMDAVGPIFKLYGKENAIRSHINVDPGTHNYEKDNRQAFYRMVGDFFYPGDKTFSADELPAEIKTKEELGVTLPENNLDLNKLALALSKKLPHGQAIPADKGAAHEWQRSGRDKVRSVVKAKDYKVQAANFGTEEKGGVKATYWKLTLDNTWTVPVVELVRGEAKGTTLLVADGGRRSVAAQTEKLLAAGQRVLAIDPFYFGESKIQERDFLFALLVTAVGDRPLGLQASQLAAAARWARSKYQSEPLTLVAVGPRTSTAALVAASLETESIGKLELHGALGSLKELIEQNKLVSQMPEMFCFGLLESFDINYLTAFVAPRPVVFVEASERAKQDLAWLKKWYALLGSDFEPLQ
jgi:hypothetical protein